MSDLWLSALIGIGTIVLALSCIFYWIYRALKFLQENGEIDKTKIDFDKELDL